MRFDRKYPILQPPDKTRPVGFKTLGKRYTPQAIRNRILYPRWRYPTGQREPVVWYGRLHGTHRKARKLPACGLCIIGICTNWGAAPQAAAPPLRCAAGHSHLDKRIRQMEFLSRHENQYFGAVGYLPPGTGTGSRCAADRAPPPPQGSTGRYRQRKVDTDHPKPQAAAAGTSGSAARSQSNRCRCKNACGSGRNLAKTQKEIPHSNLTEKPTRPDRKGEMLMDHYLDNPDRWAYRRGVCRR